MLVSAEVATLFPDELARCNIQVKLDDRLGFVGALLVLRLHASSFGAYNAST
jgi:hypothetical protein